ncbi:serine/threonine-protein kinase BLUS1-like [Vicia villosa]|uniref:serine/threonine-protein kinase BLUS1-like n=1 Tax=Vicia villosa TaxID=3911 RepID=UPI00273AD2B0|nr:serine/threonine-protein kinase BLUS1-like [Vicia villosa]
MGSGSRSYSANPSDYKLLEEVGYGASATVFHAVYLPYNEEVAVKSLDLDRCNSNFEDIRKEAQIMSLIDHRNVVKSYCSFVVDHKLWVIMPFMAQGSCLHLMKAAYPDGLEEDAIGSILKETLKALDYLHQHGHIHRDVKAGNILLDTNGEVKLSDFGVSASMFDTGDRQRSRNTFVGTPCWMAPEVLQPGTGYNFKADIWSFGITALELAHGHAPFSKYPPMKVLLMTIQNAPPGLDYDRDKKFSKSFKEMVAMCLVKDQTKRPSVDKLLKHSFFKQAKPPELSVKKLFADLPPLWTRVKALQLKDAAQLALKRMPSAEQEAISQSEYKRGVSAWNFDVEDLKAQASLVQDEDDIAEITEEDENKFFSSNRDASDSQSRVDQRNSDNAQQDESTLQVGGNEVSQSDKRNGLIAEASASTSEKDVGTSKIKTQAVKVGKTQSGPLVPGTVLGHYLPERGRLFERFENESQLSGEKSNRDIRRAPSFSGPLMLPNRASANSLSAPIKSSGGFRDSSDDKSKANLVQIKGRFSVTSENLDLVKDIPVSSVSRRSPQDSSPLKKSASVGDWMADFKQQMPIGVGQSSNDSANVNIPASVIVPHLHNLYQQTSIQQDLIMNLLNSLQTAEANDASQNGKLPPIPRSSENNGSVETSAPEREQLLLAKISELQSRVTSLTDELTSEKLKHMQLQQQVAAFHSQEQNGEREEGA